jgi:hypothetical protein
LQIALWVGVEARRPEFPPRGGGPFVVTDAVRPLIEACWAQDARARPSFEDAVGTVTRIREADDDDDADVSASLNKVKRGSSSDLCLSVTTTPESSPGEKT